MAEPTIKAKKAPLKKTLSRKKTTAKKITLKKFDDTKPVVKAAPQAIAKNVVKKPVKKAVKNTSPKPDDSLETIKSLVHEMRREHNKRDQQITAMVHEISQGFSHFAEQADAREERSLDILKALTDALKADHEKNRQETQHQQKLNHESIQQTARRNRLIAIPAAVIAILTLVTILYVVNMLGTAMTSISTDINQLQLSAKEISTRMDSISLDTNSMSGNIQQLNRNVTTMSKDLGVLSYTIAPTMRGMRNGMPWAPE